MCRSKIKIDKIVAGESPWLEKRVARRIGVNSYGDNNEDDDNTKMLYAVDMINVDTFKGIPQRERGNQQRDFLKKPNDSYS